MGEMAILCRKICSNLKKKKKRKKKCFIVKKTEWKIYKMENSCQDVNGLRFVNLASRFDQLA